MLPNIWIFDTYNLLIIIGVLAAIFVFIAYANKIKMDYQLKYTIAMIASISVIAGLVFAILFQSLFDLLEGNTDRPFAMTFYGGLLGGAGTFLALFFFYVKKKYPLAHFKDLLIISPAAITVAHGFGRIGCYAAGCCYGIETDSWLGVEFPHHDHAVYPTQLFEAIFLFLLAGVLLYLAFKHNNKYTMPIYLVAYGIWRFNIEFIRGDDRGAFFLSLSPSQWFSIVAVLMGITLFFLLKKGRQVHSKTTIPSV